MSCLFCKNSKIESIPTGGKFFGYFYPICMFSYVSKGKMAVLKGLQHGYHVSQAARTACYNVG